MRDPNIKLSNYEQAAWHSMAPDKQRELLRQKTMGSINKNENPGMRGDGSVYLDD